MTTLQIESTPQIQYPLRLSYNLHHEFRNLSKRTRIPMSTLGRLSIANFLHEVDTKGIARVLDELEDL